MKVTFLLIEVNGVEVQSVLSENFNFFFSYS